MLLLFLIVQNWAWLTTAKPLTPARWTQTGVRAATEPRRKTLSKTHTHTRTYLYLWVPAACCFPSHCSARRVFVRLCVCAGAVTPATTCGRRTGGEAGPSRTPTPSSSVRGRASLRGCRSRRTKAARFTASWRSTR